MSSVWRWLGANAWERYFTLALLIFIASFCILPTSKMVNNVYYVLIALPALGVLLARRGAGLLDNPLAWGWLVFLGWFLVPGVLSGDSQFFKHILYLLLFMATLLVLSNPQPFLDGRFVRLLFWALGLYILVSAVIYWGAGRYAVGERVLWLPARMTGPIYTSMWLASCLALAAPAWWRERRWWEVSLALPLTLFNISFVLQSRSGLVGVALLVGLGLIWLLVCRPKHMLWAMLALSLVGGMLTWGLSDISVYTGLWSRGDAGRLELWPAVLADWRGCGWWLGCGLNYASEHSIIESLPIQHPHNIFLALGVYTGLPALLLFGALMVATLALAWRQRNPWGLYLLSALCMLNFDGSLLVGNPDELWLLILLPAGLIAAGYRSSAAQARQSAWQSKANPSLRI